MNFLEFTNLIPAFSNNRVDLTKVPHLITKTNIAMKQIARDTIPLLLLKNASSDRNILRRLDNTSYVCIPIKIIDDTTDLEIDEMLLDAVALFVLAGIETARAPSYMKMYWNIVENHEQSLIESNLASNYVIVGDMANDIPDMIVDRDDYNDFIADSTIELEVKRVGEYNG